MAVKLALASTTVKALWIGKVQNAELAPYGVALLNGKQLSVKPCDNTLQ